MYKELMRRNGLIPFFWKVEAEFGRSIMVINKLTGEVRILDTK